MRGNRAIVWATKGTQFYFPYVRSDTVAGISTAIGIENVTGSATNYWILVNNPATGKWIMIKSKQPLPAGAYLTLQGSSIVTDATALATFPSSGFAVRIIVDELNNPQNVAAYATIFIGGFYRSLPVHKSAGWTY